MNGAHDAEVREHDAEALSAETPRPARAPYGSKHKRTAAVARARVNYATLATEGLDAAKGMVGSRPNSTGAPRRTANSGNGVFIGYWRRSPVSDARMKHAVIGFIDAMDRLRTRIRPEDLQGEHISNARPLPAKAGAGWVVFGKICFLPHLVGLNQVQVKEFVRLRTDAPEIKDKDEKLAAEKQTVQEAINVVSRDGVDPDAPFQPTYKIACGEDAPEPMPKRREGIDDFVPAPAADNWQQAAHGDLSGCSPEGPDSRRDQRVLPRKETPNRLGRKGKRPNQQRDNCRPRSPGACSWTEKFAKKAAAKTSAMKEPATPERPSPSNGKAGQELRTSRRIEAKKQQRRRQAAQLGEMQREHELLARERATQLSHPVTQDLDAAGTPNGKNVGPLQRTIALAQREIGRAEATQERACLHAVYRERAVAAAEEAAHRASLSAASSPNCAPTHFSGTEYMHRLNDVWARQEALRGRNGGDDSRVYDGVKYDRWKNGPLMGMLVGHGTLINIDGEDYVEYRVLTKPSFV